MAVNDSILWIYLARRDKTGIKMTSKFRGKKIIPSRIERIEDFRLPSEYEDRIKSLIYENRMLYEPWIESADDYATLVQNLKLRGYTNVPISGKLLYSLNMNGYPPEISVGNIPVKNTMIRKSS
jgi:hypothetical protein